MKEEILKKLQKIVKKLTDKDVNIQLSIPKDISNGDFTTNIAMQLFSSVKREALSVKIQSPLDLANYIAQEFGNLAGIEKIEAVAPGFINFYLSTDSLSENLERVLNTSGKVVLTSKMKDRKIIVEFTDPNPFKQLHIGHVYSNTIGEAICRLLESQGATVSRADYFGDVGMHVAKSLFGLEALFKEDKIDMKDLEKKSLDDRIAYLGKAYAKGSTIFEENPPAQEEMKLLNRLVYIAAQNMWQKEKNITPAVDYKKEYQVDDKKLQRVSYLFTTGRQWSIDYFDKVYERLGMHFNGYYPESIAGEKGYKLVTDHVQDGIFIKHEGAVIFPGKEHGLHTRVFINSLGLPTYEAKELGLAVWKYEEFPYDFSIIVTGNEIDEYFKVLIKALSLVRPDLAAKTMHIGHGMVKLATGQKMSSRTGKIITGEDVLNEGKALAKKKIHDAKLRSETVDARESDTIAEQVGIGAIKYSFLKSSIGKDVPFSFEDSVNFEGNAGPYIQYAYTRTQSILSKALTGKREALSPVVLSENEGSQSKNKKKNFTQRDSSVLPQNDTLQGRLSNDYTPQSEEIQILRKIYQFPGVVESAAENYAPNIVCEYVFELSQMFNNFYQKYRILNASSSEEKEFRLALTAGVGITLKQGLYLLGIQAPEKM